MFIGKGEWKSSIPNEIELIMQDDKHDWDWQVREISGIEWFVARIGTKTIAGMIAAITPEITLRNAPTSVSPNNSSA